MKRIFNYNRGNIYEAPNGDEILLNPEMAVMLARFHRAHGRGMAVSREHSKVLYTSYAHYWEDHKEEFLLWIFLHKEAECFESNRGDVITFTNSYGLHDSRGVLSHEQRGMDIAETFRKLVKAFKRYNMPLYVHYCCKWHEHIIPSKPSLP